MTTSLGSLTGRLDPTGLYLVRGAERVAVNFDAADLDAVWDARGRRVELVGTLTRDEQGHPIRIHLQRVEILPEPGDTPPPTTLIGADPNLTGGLDVAEYLQSIRGEPGDR